MGALRGIASEDLEPGDHVLCRDFKVAKAPKKIANGIVKRRAGAGEFACVAPVLGLGDRDLHAMANGPIMEPLRIYLPAGRCSEEEWRRRNQIAD